MNDNARTVMERGGSAWELGAGKLMRVFLTCKAFISNDPHLSQRERMEDREMRMGSREGRGRRREHTIIGHAI